MPSHPASSGENRVSSGISGLDEILHGGFVAEQVYLIRGGPGTGKTTLGMHFLNAAKATDQKTLFINLGETEKQIRWHALRSGIDLSDVAFLDLTPSPEFFTKAQSYNVFSPADVEREPTTQRIISEITALHPNRIFLDAVSHLRYLSAQTFEFRRQIHSFLRFLVEQGSTVLLTSEATEAEPDDDLQYMVDGIIELKNADFRRTLTVTKFRGSDFRSGNHSMRLSGVGMKVFPRILPGESHHFVRETISSGVPEVDQLLHGGLERGTISIISGPTGVGKTTLGIQFMKEAASRGEQSVIYIFEEIKDTLLDRSESISLPVRDMIERGTLKVVQIEPLLYTPDEFAQIVRDDVEKYNSKIVMIDSIAGYRLSLRGEDLIPHLHALSKYLQNMGVAVLLINEIDQITGDFRATENGVSYIADNLIFLRYIELLGELRRAIGVLKKRLSGFEPFLREFRITSAGITVGEPLTHLRGILSGSPTWANQDDE
ncbi:MAG: recombinase RecA [Anaerolineae bacterium]|nr:recombinase RecA [Anaerolineae bacterium]